MKNFALTFILASSLLFAATLSHASETVTGIIDFVNLKANELVVDDTEYQLAPDYKIRNNKGSVVSAFRLKTGQQVQFKIHGDRKIHELMITQ